MNKLTKNSTIAEAIEKNRNSNAILCGFGLHCFSCPKAKSETLEQASIKHQVSLDLLIEKLNETN